MLPVRDPSGLSAPRLKEALAYWHSKRAGRAMPRRRDIDPVDIPTLLPYVMLIDVLPQPLDFRYRLIGTEIRSISRRDYTGKRFSELPGKGKGSVLWHHCEQVVRKQAPPSGSTPYIGTEQYLRRCENVLLPLSEDGRDVTMILKVISFERGGPELD
jgi:hypothetical protein